MDFRPRYFSSNKKGENAELKAELNSEYPSRRKEAVKRVIANMTVGKDVSSLFADVVKNMQTEDLELKKLVYLYLINYAKTQPELVILVVNTFVKDSDDSNPLIRALAIRTMGCLRVEKILDYLLEPLKKGVTDDDPYVRKTAALCIAKMFDLAPQTTVEHGLITSLQDMLSDRNPMVIANAVAALTEVSDISVKKDVFVFNQSILAKLLAALNECTEWGQICILSSIANYKPADSREASDIVERILPRLQHANASVVLAAIRVLLTLIDMIGEELVKQVVKKMAPPLVTLLSSQPEIQYVALRNINLILQKRPDVLSSEIRVFFTKYNDPPYVKSEKLSAIIKLCDDKNIDQVLLELKEYANEVDVEFVRKSISTIGKCAMKLESAVDKCVSVLLELTKSKVVHVVQECVIVMKDIFRKYRRYEETIPHFLENFDLLDSPDSKAALIWMIGEYATLIENSEAILKEFVETFRDENVVVQLQVLTAAIKVFLKKGMKDQVQQLLNVAITVENPDVRDRAYVYWRILSTDVAKNVALAERPPIHVPLSTIGDSMLRELVQNISNLSSVYQDATTVFSHQTVDIHTEAYEDQEELESPVNVPNLLDLDFGGPTQAPAVESSSKPASNQASVNDLLSLEIGTTATAAAPAIVNINANSIKEDPFAAFTQISTPADSPSVNRMSIPGSTAMSPFVQNFSVDLLSAAPSDGGSLPVNVASSNVLAPMSTLNDILSPSSAAPSLGNTLGVSLSQSSMNAGVATNSGPFADILEGVSRMSFSKNTPTMPVPNNTPLAMGTAPLSPVPIYQVSSTKPSYENIMSQDLLGTTEDSNTLQPMKQEQPQPQSNILLGDMGGFSQPSPVDQQIPISNSFSPNLIGDSTATPQPLSFSPQPVPFSPPAQQSIMSPVLANPVIDIPPLPVQTVPMSSNSPSSQSDGLGGNPWASVAPAPVSVSKTEIPALSSTTPMSTASMFSNISEASPQSVSFKVLPKTQYLKPASANGLDLSATFSKRHGIPSFDVHFSNKNTVAMSGFTMQFNVNTFGIAPGVSLEKLNLAAGASKEVHIPLTFNNKKQNANPMNSIQVAVKNNLGVYFFQTFIPLYVLFEEENDYQGVWNDFTASSVTFEVSSFAPASVLKVYGVSCFGTGSTFYAATNIKGKIVACQVTVQGDHTQFECKSREKDILGLFQQSIEMIFKS